MKIYFRLVVLIVFFVLLVGCKAKEPSSSNSDSSSSTSSTDDSGGTGTDDDSGGTGTDDDSGGTGTTSYVGKWINSDNTIGLDWKSDSFIYVCTSINNITLRE